MGFIDNSENPSILAKACRLIGNLAQYPKIAHALQAKGIALSISNCLSEDSNPQVSTMGIRAVRLMWNLKKFRHEMLSYGSIHKVMIILYKILLNNNQDEKVEETEPESSFVIFKRHNEPDRAISKEKLNNMLEKLEKHEVEMNWEICKPEKKDDTFNMPTEKENLDLVTGIMKCLLSITATTLPHVARSVYADGFGMSCLIFLAGESSKFRAMSLKIISNLSSNTFAQEYFGFNNDLVPNISSLLLNCDQLEKPLDLSEQKFCINILCLSTENACNRGKLRRSGVFKSLLAIANTTSCDKELALLIFTFYQFRFDQLGLDTLLELGFINVMIKVLADLIEKKEVDHIKLDDPSLDEERKEEKMKQKKRSIVEQPVGFNSFSKFMRYDPGSPSSSSSDRASNNQYSPSRSSGYSPYNSPARSFQDCDDSDSDIYSPVCSDNEEEKVKKADFDILTFLYESKEIGASDKPESVEKLNGDEEMIDFDDDASNSNMKVEENLENEQEEDKAEASKRSENINETLREIESDPVQYVLQLLWKVSIKHGYSPSFVRPLSLNTLHKVSKLVQRPNGKIFQILENILLQTRNFVPVLKQDYVFKIYELSRPPYDHRDCYSCIKMKSVSKELLQIYGRVAESGYGRGEFVHFLLTGDEDLKKKVAVNLTYIISCSDILNDLLFKFKALDIVMDIILNEESLAVEACNGLTVMSKNLNIHGSLDDDVLVNKIIPDDYEHDESFLKTNNEQIKFVLKDGEMFFDKEILKNSSDVFNSMLSGHFRESNRNEITFPNYTVEGMKYFFYMVKMDQEGKLKTIAPKVNDMNVLLQAYELSILYILTDIQKPILNCMKIVLDERSVQEIFEWSIKNINQDLLISAICFYLCGNVDGKVKLNLFLAAHNSQFKNEWKQLVIDTILMKCQPMLQ